MKIAGKVIVVTGGADGIGRALAERFLKEGAKAVVIADIDKPKVEGVGGAIGTTAFGCDVSKEEEVIALIDKTEALHGPIDLFCSNAGIGDFTGSDPNFVGAAGNGVWQRSWDVNVMAHVYAARALVPRMVARGGGYFLNTASAAGLLSQIGSAVYATTKHAAVGFAEILAITHRDQGIRVSVLAPQAVDTPMLRAGGEGPQHVDGVLTPAQLAEVVVDGLDKETFLILPHPQVAGYMKKKTDNYDRWIGGMAKFRRTFATNG
ncbi:SDR family oxidoreductase [Chelatococcus reniformis]|uniref:Dehydrogenase n=1 Tax=Chelatococcus reniformis TaxID=1494448 RepID=A0A916XEW3_9HYPH|nr:SDR family oxidoreductase [Chelatococcus reniformis]GGC66841.1 dehydrogenase [Chelatococcus reniformis]